MSRTPYLKCTFESGSKETNESSDGIFPDFSVRITATETGKNLFPQWCPLRNREHKQKQLMGLVGPRGHRRPKSANNNFEMSLRVGERVCWNFGSKFPGFHRLKNVLSDAEVLEI